MTRRNRREYKRDLRKKLQLYQNRKAEFEIIQEYDSLLRHSIKGLSKTATLDS